LWTTLDPEWAKRRTDLFDIFYLPSITPLSFVEVLADLEKDEMRHFPVIEGGRTVGTPDAVSVA